MSPSRCNPFAVYRDGELISEAPLRKVVHTGIGFEPVLPGLVPEIEEREACLFSGYTWHDWQELSKAERTDGVAHFRLHHLMELHKAEAVEDAAERRRR